MQGVADGGAFILDHDVADAHTTLGIVLADHSCLLHTGNVRAEVEDGKGCESSSRLPCVNGVIKVSLATDRARDVDA